MATQMTMEMAKAAAIQGRAVKREIKAVLVVGAQTLTVQVLGDWHEGALIAREDGKLAHAPVPTSRLTISDDDAAHLLGVWEDKQAQDTGQFFSGGKTFGNCTHNWR